MNRIELLECRGYLNGLLITYLKDRVKYSEYYDNLKQFQEVHRLECNPFSSDSNYINDRYYSHQEDYNKTPLETYLRDNEEYYNNDKFIDELYFYFNNLDWNNIKIDKRFKPLYDKRLSQIEYK